MSGKSIFTKYACFAILTMTFSSLSLAERLITVTHPEVPAATLLDHGAPGQSIGDIRLWHFKANSDDGAELMTDWIMTTTGVNPSSAGNESKIESRITSAVFSFGNGTNDQIIIQGVALYPSVRATLKESSPTPRAITGGTGKFAGVGGWVETTHLKDGTWKHVLHLQ